MKAFLFGLFFFAVWVTVAYFGIRLVLALIHFLERAS